ncbi:MAG: fasciclin domain-containing protein [Ktedonobacteraceae bacterium]|nr:fasciclin domain-containing protein [Ktedonobacteraceae bacterium]
MKKNILALMMALTFGFAAVSAHAQMDPMVSGAAMYPTKNIVENAMNSKDHTTLVAAVKAAGLVETLEGPGPFTVFAPTNEAFAALPAGAVDTLLKPENKATLVKILTYHVVPGKVNSHDLKKMIKQGGGKAQLTTVQGGMLTATWKDGKFWLTDEKGGTASITIPNVYQSNGVIHVVNAVLMPN